MKLTFYQEFMDDFAYFTETNPLAFMFVAPSISSTEKSPDKISGNGKLETCQQPNMRELTSDRSTSQHGTHAPSIAVFGKNSRKKTNGSRIKYKTKFICETFS